MWVNKQAEESALLQFLDAKHGKGRLDGPDYFYDPKYALRLCLEEKRMRACVYIYGMMHMHEEAIALALQVIHSHFFWNCHSDSLSFMI